MASRQFVAISLAVLGLTVALAYGKPAERDETMLKDVEKRKLLHEMEELEEVEKEIAKRLEEESLYEELLDALKDQRKRQLRQTPVPIRRLKMTPPPGNPFPVEHLDNTPFPPGFQPNPDPPAQIGDTPLRQTPTFIRQTPNPFIPPDRPEDAGAMIRPPRPTPVPGSQEDIDSMAGHLRPTPVPGSPEDDSGSIIAPLRPTPIPTIRLTPVPNYNSIVNPDQDPPFVNLRPTPGPPVFAGYQAKRASPLLEDYRAEEEALAELQAWQELQAYRAELLRRQAEYVRRKRGNRRVKPLWRGDN